MIPLGLLEPIEDPLTALLEWLHTAGGFSWGLSIVVLTVIVRMVLLPLTIKQIRSMQKLQVVAPQLKALQTKYKNDKQRQQEEIMKFYRENKVNPAASCLPVLFQFPVFIALFFVLRDFEKEVYPAYPGSELGWLNLIPNITDPINDHLTGPNFSGSLLLVLYVASQLASIISMPMTDPRQRWIFVAMPFVFAFFILAFPTGTEGGFPIGLMIYWVTTNLWSVGQGLVTRRLMPKPEPPAKRTSRAEPRRGDGDGDGAKPRQPAPKPGTPQKRVRRRKKKGPQARR